MTQGIFEAGWRGTIFKLKIDERGVFDRFSKRGSSLSEADRRGGVAFLNLKMMFRTMYVWFQLLSPLPQLQKMTKFIMKLRR